VKTEGISIAFIKKEDSADEVKRTLLQSLKEMELYTYDLSNSSDRTGVAISGFEIDPSLLSQSSIGEFLHNAPFQNGGCVFVKDESLNDGDYVPIDDLREMDNIDPEKKTVIALWSENTPINIIYQIGYAVNTFFGLGYYPVVPKKGPNKGRLMAIITTYLITKEQIEMLENGENDGII
jgi:hypothetical protein